MKTQELWVYKPTGELVLVDREYYYNKTINKDAERSLIKYSCPILIHNFEITKQVESLEKAVLYFYAFSEKIDEWECES